MFWNLSIKGYLYDKNHAFFPLLPFLISSIRSFISIFSPTIAEPLTLIICIFIGNCVFVLSVLVFYKLSLIVLEIESYAYRATVLYIFNPAAVYFTVVYNESYFALFSLLGMYLCHTSKDFTRIIWGSLCFAMATSCRSNGAYLLLFCAWSTLKLMFTPLKLSNFLKGIITGLTCLTIVASTFFAFTIYIGYTLYCKNTEQIPEWCNAKLPNMYSFIQEKYWQVGFLKTWISNERVFRSAMWFSIPYNLLAVISVIQVLRKYSLQMIIPYVVYFVFLVLTVALIANAEINTRVCASAPVVYWVYGRWQVETDEKTSNRGIKEYIKKYIYVVYVTIYFIAEILLVPTFIGWI